jgi:hypothetical protein
MNPLLFCRGFCFFMRCVSPYASQDKAAVVGRKAVMSKLGVKKDAKLKNVK